MWRVGGGLVDRGGGIHTVICLYGKGEEGRGGRVERRV